MGYLVELLYIAAVCLLGHALHRLARIKANVTRKLIHILIGFVFLIQYYFFREDVLGLLLVPALVTVGLLLVARFRLVPSMVNPENPYGIFLYALAILLSNVISILYPPYHAAAGAAIFCLAFGDGAAALLTAPLKRRHPLLGEKSVEGTVFCFLFSFLGMWLVGAVFPALALSLPLYLLLAVLTALIELFSGRADNPAIVFGVGLAAALLASAPSALLIRLLVGTAAGCAVVILSVRARMLTLPAAMAAFLLLLLILGTGGYAAAGYILLLYAACAALHALGKRKKNRHADGARGIRQVASNGAFGGMALLLYATLGHTAFLVAYYAAIAEFVSDTMASDIGTLVPRDPIDICRLKRIPRGRSGGVSLTGTAAALAGAILSAALTLAAGLSLKEAAVVAGSAFLGVFFDSILGSLLQAKYRCSVCGAYTEKPRHCEASAIKTGGLRLLDNSNVNLLSTLFSAVLGALLTLLL